MENHGCEVCMEIVSNVHVALACIDSDNLSMNTECLILAYTAVLNLFSFIVNVVTSSTRRMHTVESRPY